jgi:hypothetical protein
VLRRVIKKADCIRVGTCLHERVVKKNECSRSLCKLTRKPVVHCARAVAKAKMVSLPRKATRRRLKHGQRWKLTCSKQVSCDQNARSAHRPHLHLSSRPMSPLSSTPSPEPQTSFRHQHHVPLVACSTNVSFAAGRLLAVFMRLKALQKYTSDQAIPEHLTISKAQRAVVASSARMRSPESGMSYPRIFSCSY